MASLGRPRWMTVEQIRKQRRMRRERVVEAMLGGELPYEQRSRIRYARECDVEAWEQRRLSGPLNLSRFLSRFKIAPELLDLL